MRSSAPDPCPSCGHEPIDRMYVPAVSFDLCRCPVCVEAWEDDHIAGATTQAQSAER